MSAAAEIPHPSFMGYVANWWRNLIGNRSAVVELSRLDSDEFRRIAADAGVAPSGLRACAGKWPDSASLLSRRMATRHLDMRDASPPVANDLARLCSTCGVKARCGHDLDARSVQPAWRSYCPNSGTLMALRDGKSRSVHDDARER